MNLDIDMRVLELLCARLCHELVGPVAAINNGVELLGEDDPDFVSDAVKLLGQSARKAGQRLQFYRFAYGSAASSGSKSAIIDPRALAAGLLEDGKVRCDWPAESVEGLASEWQKLACNMLVLAADALPRGGSVLVKQRPAGSPRITVTAEGTINFPEEQRAALGAGAAIDALTSRTVHAYFTARLALRLGAPLTLAVEPQILVLAAPGA
ncbi:MAG TPA: histidine phosphotransferase family protein [Stellaceae bacterium]|nr:histidine phosphotransferase family protein [Stellaceae bacterium]